MPGNLASSDAWLEAGLLAVAAVAVGLLAFIVYRAWKTARLSTAERERRRRTMLVDRGKMGDAALVEVREDVLVYSYLVRGVEYIASQDVSALKELVPQDMTSALAVKYLAENPANSIVLAEEWSGLFHSRTNSIH